VVTLTRRERRKLERQMAKETVTIRNELMVDAFGEPLLLANSDGPGTFQAWTQDVLVRFLRARNPQTAQSFVAKSMDDSERIRSIGQCIQQVTDGHITLAEGDHRWLLKKVEETAYAVFPAEAALIKDAFQAISSDGEAGSV